MATPDGSPRGASSITRAANRAVLDALPFDDVSSVQKPTNEGAGLSGVEKLARTFEKSPALIASVGTE